MPPTPMVSGARIAVHKVRVARNENHGNSMTITEAIEPAINRIAPKEERERFCMDGSGHNKSLTLLPYYF